MFREVNKYNTMMEKLEFNEKDYFCSFSTFPEYVDGIERYELYGCIFGHVLGFRFLPNKFTEEMEKSGYFNKVYFTNFSNLLL